MKLDTNIKNIVAELERRIADELSPIDTERAYRDMLDECSEQCAFCKSLGSPSRLLLELDPVAYRCGQNDFEDSRRDEWTEVDGNYYETREVDKIKEALLDELTDELNKLEEERDELEEGAEQSEFNRIEDEISEASAQVAELEKHSF